MIKTLAFDLDDTLYDESQFVAGLSLRLLPGLLKQRFSGCSLAVLDEVSHG